MEHPHLNALELRLSHEREYLRAARTENEKQMRNVWISQIEKEIADERRFLEMPKNDPIAEISDAELLESLRS